jgi:hypothetical protein
MPTLVALTDFWSVQRGQLPATQIVVNLDQVKTIQRLPAHPGSDTRSGLPERTQLWFGGYGPDVSEQVFVTETPDEIFDAAHETLS